MTRYRISGNLSEPLTLVALKTLVHPCIVWLLATQAFNLPKLWTSVAVTLAALPAGINGYLFAQRYNIGVATTASAVLVSTGSSALTPSVLIYVLVAS